MTFTEIFDNFKNHSYIRRKAWSEHVFIQLRHSTQMIRLVHIDPGVDKLKIITLNNDTRLTTEDLLADDWNEILITT